ncbi:nucleotide sugar dehydrogenase [Luteimonas terrae]|uniref:Nucleotide sugar dehydrogenase n=1 Tax=Luteimonas terrae TaxID=1530191 RepID=A0A4R5UBX0_9GAMM|nr:nucleotide sugar dehydrogenase [Luteimonas terrae]TDK32673.1 nucleotide sugar dehydrogenase [Luteimonas terrae]
MTAPLPARDEIRIAVIGLGYVGLPLAVAFGRRHETLGFDIDAVRVEGLQRGDDHTRELSPDELRAATRLRYSAEAADLAGCNVHIVTVPTPVDAYKRPDLSALEASSRAVGASLQRGGVVIFESTVYPGATEEICVPILEAVSGLRYREDFHVGYSPERINPGDKQHRLENTLKVTAGSSDAAAEFVDTLYRDIVEAGTHRVSSIRVAEAAKVIENTQRDVNIALVNELALIFDRLGIDTHEVLEAAGTKWNFLPFRPGLVGGHCIGVDPYYLTHKAQEIGYHPEVILAGRRINDSMGLHVAQRVVKLMQQRGIQTAGARVLVLGLAFKENCPDLRNTRVIDVVRELQSYSIEVDVHDPWVAPAYAQHEYGLAPIAAPQAGTYDAVVLAVAHTQFRELGGDGLRAFGKPGAVLFDVKAILPADAVDARL